MAPRARSAVTGVLVGAAAIALAGCGDEAVPVASPAAAPALAALAGVPERGDTIGRPGAPVTGRLFVELAAIDGNVTREVLPALIARYVRPGRVKLQLRTVTAERSNELPDGGLAVTRIAQAASVRGGSLWRFYVTYGSSFTGVDDPQALARALAAARVPGPATATTRTARSPRVLQALKRSRLLREELEVEAPALVLTRAGERPRSIDLSGFPSGARVVRQVASALARGER